MKFSSLMLAGSSYADNPTYFPATSIPTDQLVEPTGGLAHFSMNSYANRITFRWSYSNTIPEIQAFMKENNSIIEQIPVYYPNSKSFSFNAGQGDDMFFEINEGNIFYFDPAIFDIQLTIFVYFNRYSNQNEMSFNFNTDIRLWEEEGKPREYNKDKAIIEATGWKLQSAFINTLNIPDGNIIQSSSRGHINSDHYAAAGNHVGSCLNAGYDGGTCKCKYYDEFKKNWEGRCSLEDSEPVQYDIDVVDKCASCDDSGFTREAECEFTKLGAPQQRVDTYEECLQACKDDSTCVAVTFMHRLTVDNCFFRSELTNKVCTGRRDFMAFTFSRKCELLPECTGVDACSIDNMDLEIVAEYNWDPTWDCSVDVDSKSCTMKSDDGYEGITALCDMNYNVWSVSSEGTGVNSNSIITTTDLFEQFIISVDIFPYGFVDGSSNILDFGHFSVSFDEGGTLLRVNVDENAVIANELALGDWSYLEFTQHKQENHDYILFISINGNTVAEIKNQSPTSFPSASFFASKENDVAAKAKLKNLNIITYASGSIKKHFVATNSKKFIMSGIDTIKKGIKFSLDSPRGNFIVLSDSQYSAWNQWEIKFTTYNTVAILRKGTTISSATYKAEEGKQWHHFDLRFIENGLALFTGDGEELVSFTRSDWETYYFNFEDPINFLYLHSGIYESSNWILNVQEDSSNIVCRSNSVLNDAGTGCECVDGYGEHVNGICYAHLNLGANVCPVSEISITKEFKGNKKCTPNMPLNKACKFQCMYDKKYRSKNFKMVWLTCLEAKDSSGNVIGTHFDYEGNSQDKIVNLCGKGCETDPLKEFLGDTMEMSPGSCVATDNFISFTESAAFRGKCKPRCQSEKDSDVYSSTKPLKCFCKDNEDANGRICNWHFIDNPVKAFGKGFWNGQVDGHKKQCAKSD